MTDCPPNDYWPTRPIRARHRQNLNTATGLVPMYAADPHAIAGVLDDLAANPDTLTNLQAASLHWAQLHSWDAMLEFYFEELAYAAERA